MGSEGGVRVWGLWVLCFSDTATTEIYTLSLHDALPIFSRSSRAGRWGASRRRRCPCRTGTTGSA